MYIFKIVIAVTKILTRKQIKELSGLEALRTTTFFLHQLEKQEKSEVIFSMAAL